MIWTGNFLYCCGPGLFMLSASGGINAASGMRHGDCLEITCGSGKKLCAIRKPACPVGSFPSKNSFVFYKLLADVEHTISKVSVDSQHTICNGYGYKELLLTKYAPQKFTELLSDEAINIELLKWLSKWRREPNGDQHPIVLIHGPPGYGKTTMAHIIARTAQFEPIEINASDERGGELVLNRINNILNSDPLFNHKPSCLIIDEIDGAQDTSSSGSTSLISFLVSLIVNRDKPTSKQSARRPIICVCNDMYAPALRLLRHSLSKEFIISYDRPSNTLLANRLKSICDEEGIVADTRALLQLCTLHNSDIRACLNSLQLIIAKSDRVTVRSIENSFDLTKDVHLSPLSILEALFSSAGNQRKHLQKILNNIDETEKVIFGCYENYATAKFFDDKRLSRVNMALDCISWYDHKISGKDIGNRNLACYSSTVLLQLHLLFASPTKQHLSYPHLDYDLMMSRKNAEVILSEFLKAIPATLSRYISIPFAISVLVPYLLTLISPDVTVFQSTNQTLMGEKEKMEMHRLMKLFRTYGLKLKQEKTFEGIYYFSLEPPIHRLLEDERQLFEVINDGAHSKSYSIYQILNQELHGRNSISNVQPKTSINLVTNKMKRDFFGRIISQESSIISPQSSISKHQKFISFWYKHNEGYSNAVRRDLRIDYFIEILDK